MTAAFDVKKLLQQPDLPQIMRQVVTILQSEESKRLEFYDWIDESMKAEFINGEIIVHSPAKLKHTRIRENLSRILSIYALRHKTGIILGEKAMVHLTRNSYEPDIAFWNNEKSEKFDDEQSLFPAPDFVVEILSKGTKKRDKGIKMQDYALHHIKEYWIINPDKNLIEQYLLVKPTDTVYTLSKKVSIEGTIDCVVMAGLNIPLAAIFTDIENLPFIMQLL